MVGRFVLVMLVTACGSAGSGTSTPADGRTRPEQDPAIARPGQTGGASAATPAATVVRDVSLAGEVREADGVDLVLQNRAAVAVSLAADVTVERDVNGAFATFSTNAFALRFACDAPPVACLELVPGAELRPPAWRGASGRAQCDQPGGDAATAGRYRFVARTCDGARIEGEPFELR